MWHCGWGDRGRLFRMGLVMTATEVYQEARSTRKEEGDVSVTCDLNLGMLSSSRGLCPVSCALALLIGREHFFLCGYCCLSF